MKSKLFKLNWRDVGRGLITAVISTVVTWLYGVLQSGTSIFEVDWKAGLGVGLTAMIGYFALNLGTNEKGKFLKE